MLYIETLEENSQKARHSGGINLLRRALFKEFGLKINETDILRGEYGKPYINEKGVHFSISHSQDRAAVLVCSNPCGVDIERIRSSVNPAIVSRVCTNAEAEFIGDCAKRFALIWTLKESYVKAVGRGLGFGLKNIEFTVQGNKISSSLGGKFDAGENDGFMVSCCIL